MKTTLIFLLSLIGFTSMSQNLPTGFETVAYEGFDYTNGQDLINVGGGTGWTSNWQQFYLNRYISARSTSYSYTGLSTTGGKATFDSSCYGSCNDISSSGRELTATTDGVLYLQFLANLGSQVGGGTPHVRLGFNGSTTVILGKIGDDGHNWGLYDATSGASATTGISGNNILRMVIVRFDYSNNTMRMYIDPNLSTFDYSNPSGHDAEISGISIPYFDEIGPMFRYNSTPGIDEIHVFKESSETFTNGSGDGQWDTASNWASGSVPTSSTDVAISSGQTIEAGSSAFNSIRLDKSQSNYLSINNSSGTFQETGDFTFEMWVKINEWDCGYACYKAAFLGYDQHNFWLSINGSGKPQFRMGCGDLTFNYSATSNNWDGNWKHMAIVRDGTTLKFFVDGVLEATSSCSGGTFMNSSTIKIGKNDGWTHHLDAWISKIRYVKGSALYSSNFTPPTSLSNVAGTHLLLNVDSQTNAFVDSSDNNHTISIHGSTDPYFVSSNGPSGSGNSTTAVANNITVDSGGSLTIAKNSDLTISGNFTNNGTVTLNSDADEFASIIVGGTSSGDIIYNRYVNTQGSGEWDLIGAPTDGLSISSFVTTNSTPLATSGSIYAVGTYDNSNDTWTNFTTSSVGAAGNFDIGRGYQMATSSGATMAFTGT
ncbi:LamG domain-containing protein, partial [bacterium]|nr:LamG domain-containing protein [bacterium]